jgi:transcriptional regulator with XRE-family HTH domain
MTFTRELVERIVGANIRKAREKFLMTPECLAAEIGVSAPEVAEIEAGRRGVDAYQLIAMCILFAKHVPYFFEWEEEPSDPKADVVIQ